jgi:hypothetical protein
LLLVVAVAVQIERLVVVERVVLEPHLVLLFLLGLLLPLPLVLAARRVVEPHHIPHRQTGLILSLVRLLQLVAGLVLAVNMLAPLLVMEALGVVRVVILVDLQTAQASLGRVLTAVCVLTPLLQKAVVAAAEQVQLA